MLLTHGATMVDLQRIRLMAILEASAIVVLFEVVVEDVAHRVRGAPRGLNSG